MANDSGSGSGFWSGDLGSIGNVGGIADSMNNFAATAAAGGFSVSESAGKEMLSAVHEMQDWLKSQFRSLGRLEEQLPLGDSHAARVIKPFNVQVATDAQGFLTQLKAFGDSLPKIEEGIKKAMENYREAEQDNQQKFSGA